MCWWQKPEETLADQRRFLNQAMVYGVHNDSLFVDRVYGEDALRDAIENAQPGLWDTASWRYWRLRLGLYPDAPLPVRKIGEDNKNGSETGSIAKKSTKLVG